MTPHAPNPRRPQDLAAVTRASSETLENRRLLASISLAGTVLSLTGDAKTANVISFDYAADKKTYVAMIGSSKKSFALSAVKSLLITGGSGSDDITIGSNITLGSVIRPGNGNDTVYGGAGADWITDPSGGNHFYLGAGNDWVSGSAGDDTIDGGAGNDTVFGNGGHDLFTGDAGDDYFDGGASTDTFDGGPGNDTSVNVEKTTNVEHAGGTTAPTTPTTPSTPTTPTTPTTGKNDLPTDAKAAKPSPVITAIATSVNVGQAVFVNGLSSKLNAGTTDTAHYEWDFGDSGSVYDKLVGFSAGHVYAKAGTYSVTLKLWNQSYGFAQTSIKVTVSAPSHTTYYVSAAGSDSNGGTSAGSPLKSVAKAASLAASKSNVSILFRDGDTFSTSKTLDVKGSNVTLGSYGSGKQPVIKWTGGLTSSDVIRIDSHGTIVQGLTFDSIYTGPNNGRTGMPFAIHVYGDGTVVRGCTFLNLGYDINANGTPTGLLVQDSSSPTLYGLHDYFLWAQGSDFVVLGDTVANSTNEHPIRVFGVNRMLIAYNDLKNPQAYGFETSKTALNIQKGSDVYVYHNILRGPRVQVGPLGGADGVNDKSSSLTDVVLEGNTLLDTQVEVEYGATNVYARNNVFDYANTNAFQIQAYSSTYKKGVNNLNIANNTFINTGATGTVLYVEGAVNGITLVNNLYQAPKMYVGTFGTAALYVHDTSLKSFKTITNNLWAVPSVSHYYQVHVPGGTGFTFVGTDQNDTNDYYDLARWNALGSVGTDQQANVSVSTTYNPTSQTTMLAKGVIEAPGVFGDFNGDARDLNDAWTIGAVQL